MSDRTSIEDRQQRLSTRIQSYNSKGSVLMEIETGTDLEVVVAPVSFDEDTILDEGEDEDEDDEDEVAEGPERMQVIMPSSFNCTDITRLGLENLAHQELELQQGQANDALEHLHLALGQKALLWHTKVQPANTNKKCTQAWDDIKAARQQVEKHVRSYHRARKALLNLGADEDIM